MLLAKRTNTALSVSCPGATAESQNGCDFISDLLPREDLSRCVQTESNRISLSGGYESRVRRKCGARKSPHRRESANLLLL
jgi:hypothetical protein